MATTWTRATYDAATAHDAARADGDPFRARDDARRRRIADAIRARGEIADADVADVAALTVAALDAASFDFDAGRTMVYDAHMAEARGLDALDDLEASLRAKHAAARASWETPLPPQTDPWADSHGGPARTPTARDDARRALAEARTDLYDAQTAARTARYAVAVAKAARLRATATLAVVRATEAEARV